MQNKHNNDQGQKNNDPQGAHVQTQPKETWLAGYMQEIKKNIFKRKVILLIFNFVLLLLCFLFGLLFIIVVLNRDQTNDSSEPMTGSSIAQKVMNKDTLMPVLVLSIAVMTLCVFFSVVILKGKVGVLHCYWLTCLTLLVSFSLMAVWAYSVADSSCNQPSNYIFMELRMVSISATSLFCSNSCPCQQSLTRPSQQQIVDDSTAYYSSVQQCPGWQQTVYSQFFNFIEKIYKCSGWCEINSQSYYVFSRAQAQGQEDDPSPDLEHSPIPAVGDRVACFDVVGDKLESQTKMIKVFSLLICCCLFIIILYTNYYIFMEKEDKLRQTKKIKRKIKNHNRKMEQQLKTSRKLL